MIVSVVVEAQEAVCIESGDKDRTVAAIVVADIVGMGLVVVALFIPPFNLTPDTLN